jgi:hypothetical protein
VLAAWPLASEASRDHRPMGYYINRADLIVSADAGKPEPEGNLADFAGEIHRMPVRFPISAREVLKGDAGLVGQEIVLRHEHVAFLGSKGFAYISPDARGIAVLLKPGWKEARAWPVLEVYRTSEEIAALRTLVGICAIEPERDRLIRLQALHAAGNPIFREEFIAQLRDMRDPANFPFLTDLYPTLEPKDQLELVEIIGQIGDLRGVPTLLEAVNSPDSKVSQTAVYQLTAYYPGAPGIIETFEKNLGREHLTRAIAGYLARRRPTPEVKTLAEGPDTSWGRARQLLGAGKKDEAQAPHPEMRLRDVKDRRVIRELVASLCAERHATDPNLVVVDLVKIGGPVVEEELTTLLTDNTPSMATEALFMLQGDRSKELARRILSEENFGDRMRAYHVMGRLGTAEDLDHLLPLADFWTGDRENHHWAMSAVASIRERLGLDIHGTIRPASWRFARAMIWIGAGLLVVVASILTRARAIRSAAR